jgi:hypothetical protein
MEFMKRSIINLVIAMLLFVTTASAEDQLLLRISGGYGLGVQPVLLGQAYTATTTENVYGTFGGGWGFTLGAGLELSKYIDFGIDLGYQNGRSVVVEESAYSIKTFTARLITFSPSLTFKTDIDNIYTPYARIGLLTGYPIINLNVSNSDKNFSGGFPIGVTEAIGTYVRISDYIKLFAEINHQTMIYKPTQRVEEDGTIVKFKDRVPYPEVANEEITHHYFSFGAVGLSIGVIIIL